MKLSFIVPAYNEEKYLGKCLESIFKEISANPGLEAEVLVVNNASTDNTRAVAASFPGAKIVDEPRKGLVIARQAGAAAAQGDLLAHIDADCILPKNWTKTVLKEFARSKNLVALSGPFIYYDLSAMARFWIKVYYYLGFAFYWFNSYILRVGSLLQGGNFVVRHWAWDKMEKAGKDFTFYGEDIIIAKNLTKLGRVKFTLSLPIFTSGRRLKQEGVLVSALLYVSNFFFVTYFKKPATKSYQDIRTVTK